MCEVISLEYKYLDGVQAPEMGTANHSNALSTFQVLHNPQIPRAGKQGTVSRHYYSSLASSKLNSK